jgi:hypothetical protein
MVINAYRSAPHGHLVEDGWREFSRPELAAVCRLQRPTDDHPARIGVTIWRAALAQTVR